MFIFRFGLSSCSPAYKCKWENTANQRRSSKLLHRLLILSPWRSHSTSSWFNHVSRWSWGEDMEHGMLWTFPHLYFIFRLGEDNFPYITFSVHRLTLWVELLMKHSISANKGLKNCFMLLAWGKTVALGRLCEPAFYVSQTSFHTYSNSVPTQRPLFIHKLNAVIISAISIISIIYIRI